MSLEEVLNYFITNSKLFYFSLPPVCLQPFVFDPNEKNKHKFMVQSLIAPDGEFNTEQVWKDVSPEQLMDAKLRCAFEIPEEKKENVSQLSTQMLKNEVSMMNDSMNSAGSGGAETNAATKALDGDLSRATVEIRELREENSRLRQDSLELNVSREIPWWTDAVCSIKSKI